MKFKKIKRRYIDNYYKVFPKNESLIFQKAKLINFDRLKIAIPITKTINFTYTDSYFDKVAIENQSNLEWELKKESLFNCHIQTLLGINEISINGNILILDITGKIVSKEENLGYLNKYTIKCALNKVKNSNAPISFNVNEAIKSAYLLYCDITQDICVSDPNEILKTFKLLLPSCSNRFKVIKYKTGLMLTPIAKSVKDSLCVYKKHDEIIRKPSNYLASEYRKTIGTACIEKTKNILRIERHLGSWKAIRKALGVDKKNKIPLISALNSKTKPILNRLRDYRISIIDLKEKIESTQNIGETNNED